ncbi:MAG: hypothetical protein DMG25_09800 [Acidobacteria bacterium]|nr:MAG: hypothetical protein DMG25_09800 [Acidobacteriota bacterium]
MDMGFWVREGAQELRSHLLRERKRSLVEAKKRIVLARDGCLVCEACGASSEALPAELGEACFEVHHLKPLFQLSAEQVTRLDDVALLCANCHRMIHWTSLLMPLSQFKAVFRIGRSGITKTRRSRGLAATRR